MKAFVTLAASLLVTSSGTTAASPAISVEPYAAYVTYVTTFEARGSGADALAVGRLDPTGARCPAAHAEVCTRYKQERALADAIPVFALAMRAKALLGDSPSADDVAIAVEVGNACADHADRLAATGLPPLRKIVGPYTAGMVKSKLCNALLAAGANIAH